jgi:hypothetical protein
MHNFARFMVVSALIVAVSACGEQPSEPAQAAAPATSPQVPASVVQPIVVAPVVNPVDSLVKTMATDAISTQVGKVVEGQMTNGGKAGFLLFGPYISFSAGTYAVTTKGRIEELPAGQKVRLDVVSARGRTKHGQIEVKQTGDLPTFEFTLPEAVGDVEIRVLVPAGSKVAVESYQVTKKL